MGNGKTAVKVIGKLFGCLGATHIGGDNDGVFPVKRLFLKVIAQEIQRGEV